MQVFTFIYLAELLLNMFGNWFWAFWGSSWCIFDLCIVLLSVIDAVYVIAGTSGNGLAVLRLLRIFRIVRIFNKLEDMRRILSANVSAFGPVINAIILFVVTIGGYLLVLGFPTLAGSVPSFGFSEIPPFFLQQFTR